jgi:hypothetical protein
LKEGILLLELVSFLIHIIYLITRQCEYVILQLEIISRIWPLQMDMHHGKGVVQILFCSPAHSLRRIAKSWLNVLQIRWKPLDNERNFMTFYNYFFHFIVIVWIFCQRTIPLVLRSPQSTLP